MERLPASTRSTSGLPAGLPPDIAAEARARRGMVDAAQPAPARSWPANAPDRRRAPRRPSPGAASFALALAPVGLVACVAAVVHWLANPLVNPLAGPTGSPPPEPPWAAGLALHGPGPAYALSLPMALRAASGHADPDALRVRNGHGEAVPFAWLAPRAAPDQARPAPATIRRSTLPDGTAAWIVDAHAADADLELDRLDLTLAPRAQGVFDLRVEAGDDGRHWQVVRPAARIVRLAAPSDGSAPPLPLVSTTIALDGISARYLRLTTLEGDALPAIAGVLLTRVPRQAMATTIEWSDTIAPSACEDTRCDYPLPPDVPVEQLQVVPADADVAARVTVLGEVDDAAVPMCRHQVVRDPVRALRQRSDALATLPAGTAWEPLTTAEVYRSAPTTRRDELRSPPLRLDGQAWPVLRLQIDGRLGHVPPLLRIGAHPRTLVFLAHGAGPFRLERVDALSPRPPGAPIALAALLAADSGAATPGVASLAPAAGPASMLPTPSSALPSWTWAVLLAGLAAVGMLAAASRAAAQRAAPANW